MQSFQKDNNTVPFFGWSICGQFVVTPQKIQKTLFAKKVGNH